jgi:hypothetical protein
MPKYSLKNGSLFWWGAWGVVIGAPRAGRLVG